MKTVGTAMLAIVLGVFVTVQAINGAGARPAETPVVEVAVDARQPVSEGSARVFGYSGNIWLIPGIFELGISDFVLDMPRLGMVRIGLGDEILAHAQSMEDLRRRLEEYPLNDFLRKYHARGGRVVVILDSVPMWASSNRTREKKGHLEIFRLSPPADYNEWGRIVSTIVRHFNGTLDLGAYYEVWNEPDVDFLGTNEQYAKLFYHSVVGAKRADADAKVGGPGVSAFSATKTAGGSEPANALQPPLMFEWLLEYTSRTPVPELGLKRVPVDFVSWHAYYKDPSHNYEQMVVYLRDLLERKGYPRSTPLLDTEWNIAAVPAFYTEGDLNATEVGAAYVANTLIAMDRAGIDGQVFQMFVDPGVEGYSAGTFTRLGVPRANFNTFRLFSELKGHRLQTRTDDEWVKAVSYTDGDKLYLLISAMMPTRKMFARGLQLRRRIESIPILRDAPDSVSREDLAAFLKSGKSLPEPLQSRLTELVQRDRQAAEDYKSRVGKWQNGIQLDISLHGLRADPGRVRRYVIDAQRSNVSSKIEQVSRQLVDRNQALKREAKSRLESQDVRDRVQQAFFKEIVETGAVRKTLAYLDSEKEKAAVKDAYRNLVKGYKAGVRAILEQESGRLYSETLSWPESDILRVHSQPYSAQLFVFEK